MSDQIEKGGTGPNIEVAVQNAITDGIQDNIDELLGAHPDHHLRIATELIRQGMPTLVIEKIGAFKKNTHNAIVTELVQNRQKRLVLEHLTVFKLNHRFTVIKQLVTDDLFALEYVCAHIGTYVAVWKNDDKKPFTKEKALRLGNFLLASVNAQEEAISAQEIEREDAADFDAGENSLTYEMAGQPSGEQILIMQAQVLVQLEQEFPGVDQELNVNADIQEFEQAVEQ